MDNSITYQSTRGRDKGLSFDDALINGLALDGGLYMPNRWPKFTYQDLLEMKDLDYIRLTEKIATPFVGQNLKTNGYNCQWYKFQHLNNNESSPNLSMRGSYLCFSVRPSDSRMIAAANKVVDFLVGC